MEKAREQGTESKSRLGELIGVQDMLLAVWYQIETSDETVSPPSIFIFFYFMNSERSSLSSFGTVGLSVLKSARSVIDQYFAVRVRRPWVGMGVGRFYCWPTPLDLRPQRLLARHEANQLETLARRG